MKHPSIELLLLFLGLTYWSCNTGTPDFVLIPAGDYLIGEEGHAINPKRNIHLESFSISIHEVTNAEFAAFVAATGYTTTAENYHNAMNFHVGLDEFEWEEDSSSWWRYPFGTHEPGIEDKMDHPVTCISFEDALAYCDWKDERLPTLEEWEVACRAGASTAHYWGEDENAIHHYANIWENKTHKELLLPDSNLYTAPVKARAANLYGLYDMYGNVFEFCSNLPPALADQPQLAAARGGSWWCSTNSCNYFNSADIGRVHRFASFPNHGFRTVKEKK